MTSINWHRNRAEDDFTDEEIDALQKIPHNYKFSDAVKLGVSTKAELPVYEFSTLKMKLKSQDLPESHDLSKYSPEIYAQGDLGSCVSNSTSMGWRISRLAHNDKSVMNKYVTGYKDVHPSRLYIYFNAKIVEGTPSGEDTGCTVHGALLGIERHRVCREEIWEYDLSNFGVQPSLEAYGDAIKHSPMSFTKVLQNEKSIKLSLVSGFPVMFGAVVFEDCKSRSAMHTGVIPTPNKEKDEALGGHCLLIVGYDDEKRQFKIQNSWGRIWGDRGCGYMSYDYILDNEICGDFWAFKL